ncbi:MAG: DUF5670 family protein [Candidatus Acidiferrales bacterium]
MSIFTASLVLWFLGIVTDSMFGGFLHLLLLVALLTAGIGMIQHRKLAKVRRRW